MQLESNLCTFAKILDLNSKPYRKAAAARKEAINALMWNEESGHSLTAVLQLGFSPSYFHSICANLLASSSLIDTARRSSDGSLFHQSDCTQAGFTLL